MSPETGEPPTLIETLKLERLELNLFRGRTPEAATGRIFGGQVVAQSLLAAYDTVEDRVCHSLHGYFIRPGDPDVPIIFEVDRARDGGSFTTRRVIALQHGKQILNLAASFMAPEAGLEHQAAMPKVPHWSELPNEDAALIAHVERSGPEELRRWMSRMHPIETRAVDGRLHTHKGPQPPSAHVWFRSREPIGEAPHLHQALLAYASDMNLLSTSLRPHRARLDRTGIQGASLDHAVWFHRPTDFTRWHLYVHDSPWAGAGRGFIQGAIYDEAGVLVASVAQEALIRIRKPKAE